MKKTILTTALIAAIAIGTAATYASANWGQRGGGYWNDNNQAPDQRMQMQYNQAPGQRMQMQYNQAPGQRMQMQAQQLDPAVKEKMDKFFTDTQDLHKEITVKRAEQMAMIRSENPDPGAVGKLAGELFDLRATVRQKAEEAGVAAYLGPNGPRGGRDFGPGRSGMRGGANKGGRSMNNMQGAPGPRGYWN